MIPASLFAGLFIHFALISIMAIGGFMATLPGMYSYLVDIAALLTPEQFAKTVAFGQSLPGPNMLIAGVLGWAACGPLGALATLSGTAIPFSLIAVAAVAIGLLFATAYLLLSGDLTNWKSVCWAAVVTLIVWRTKFPLILLIAAGGVLGALGVFA